MNKEFIEKAEKSVSDLLVQLAQYTDISEKAEKLSLQKQQISDAMTFANPLVWMMYKHKAYVGTDHAIVTFGDLKKHASKPGDICTKRFLCILEFIKKNHRINIYDSKKFPNDMPLEDFYFSSLVESLLSNHNFMESWEKYEYFKENNKVAKWKNY